MSTKAGTIGVSARPALFTVWTAAVSALAVTALIMSAVALNVAVRSGERPSLQAARDVAAPGRVITGTGPGLIQVAGEPARTTVVPRIYSGSAVTGTGPGLAVVALEHSQPYVTGTGPGLIQVADGTERP
ncbi:MAG TPA: hypothetical protein VGL18_11305 [Actinomycetota bacterium]|jgi:hypothetical protein|nr:hypothetical protein [Actinomycetota bacterium]